MTDRIRLVGCVRERWVQRNPTIKRPNRERDSFVVSDDYRFRYSLS